MFYLKCALIMNISLLARGFLLEDLQLLFDNKPCIEASLVSISSAQEAAAMIDKNSPTISSLVNITEITKKDYEKSVATQINELAQYNEIQYSYELVSEKGPAHNKIFEIVLKLGDEKYAASGSSLKEAKNAAAKLAITDTYYEHPPTKLKSKQEESLTPTVILNNVAMKLGVAVSYALITGNDEQAIASYGSYDESYGKSKSYFSKLNSSSSMNVPTEEAQISGPFTVRVKVGDSVYVGIGHTIQAARHEAAVNAIKSMEKQVLYKNNVCASEESAEECKQKREELKSPISRVYEAAQTRNLPVEFNIISESGKSHKKVFVTRCKLGDFITEGEGNSKQDSKKRAAEKMLDNFPQFSELVNGNTIINSMKTKKKKKKNIVKKNVQNLGDSISNMLTQIWSTNEDSSASGGKDNTKMDNPYKGTSKTNGPSPKDKILELGNILNVQVQFTDLNEYKGQFYTLMSLAVNPKHICLGKAPTRDESHNVAALHGLKFLRKEGALGKAQLSKSQQESYYIEDYLEGDYFYTSIEDIDKSDT